MKRCPYLSKGGDSVCGGRLLVDTQDPDRKERTLRCVTCGRTILQQKRFLLWKTVKVSRDQPITARN